MLRQEDSHLIADVQGEVLVTPDGDKGPLQCLGGGNVAGGCLGDVDTENLVALVGGDRGAEASTCKLWLSWVAGGGHGNIGT